jgi:gluconokinase
VGKADFIKPEGVEAPLILAIDIGTSAVRMLLFDRLGRATANACWRKSYAIRTSREGASEVDADALLQVVWEGIDAVLVEAGPLAEEIAGVAACTFVGNIMGIDHKARPLTPIFTYADTRAEKQVRRLQIEFEEGAVHVRTGCHFHSSYLPARFLWLMETRPELTRKVARWVSLGEYMALKLFGEARVSYSAASWTGLLDRSRLVWDAQLLAALPVDVSQLSPLTDISAPQRGLRPEFATRWPGFRDLPWFPAVGDGAAANIGTGCVSSSRVALTMGSTTAVRTVTHGPVEDLPEGVWCYRVDGGRSLPGGALSEGGNVFAWMKQTLQLGDPASLEQRIGELKPDGHGLTLLPFLAGERAPGWQGMARAAIDGIRLATTPVEILRAGMEAVACRITLVLDRLGTILPPDFQIVAGGGALRKSPVWLQIITDMLGREIEISSIQEPSARGAALLAFEALGLVDNLESIPDFIERTCHPDSERHEIYRRALKRQLKLYEELVKEPK